MNKKKISQEILKYTVIFEPASEGGYVTSVPALPGCRSQGETFEEAVAMIQDAIKGYLEVAQSEGLAVTKEDEEAIITKVTVPYNGLIQI